MALRARRVAPGGARRRARPSVRRAPRALHRARRPRGGGARRPDDHRASSGRPIARCPTQRHRA
ncbi:MAG: hypothetical protein E6F95_10205 [Actinobacteria bacterium]|nr:MAG: hypothetical protein E6F95_10205 [Actinomycetota bacterium]